MSSSSISRKSQGSSHRKGSEAKHHHSKSSTSSSPQTLTNSSNISTYNSQTRSLQHSSSQGTSTTSMTGIRLYSTESPQWPANQTYDYTLYGISAQFADTTYHQPIMVANIDQKILPCPYHTSILRYPYQNNDLSIDKSNILDSYQNDNGSEQYALFCRPDTGELSTHKACACITHG